MGVRVLAGVTTAALAVSLGQCLEATLQLGARRGPGRCRCGALCAATRAPCGCCRAATVDGDIFLLHQEAALMYGAETQHGRGWRVTGVGGAAGLIFPVCESLLLG